MLNDGPESSCKGQLRIVAHAECGLCGVRIAQAAYNRADAAAVLADYGWMFRFPPVGWVCPKCSRLPED